MKLTEGIYFFKSGENTYLRNVNNARDYLFNEIVFDILTIMRDNNECDLEIICNQLSLIYDVENDCELKEDVSCFLQALLKEGIMTVDDSVNEKSETDVSSLISKERGDNNSLFSASLELTYRCNEKCIHCYVDDCPANNENELTFDEYKQILHQLKDMGCVYLLLTGGEVCLRKDFIEIAQYAVSLGFLVDIYTNGISITDEQFDELCAMKINSISFSLYSGEASVHDSITKVSGSFELTLKRAMMFKCAGVDTFIKAVAIEQNYEHLESLYQLGRRIGIKVNVAVLISNTHSGTSTNTYRLKNQEQRRKVMNLVNKYAPSSRAGGKRDLSLNICSAAFNSLSIDPYGGVHPCLAFVKSAGSIRKSKIKDIWEKSKFMQEVRALRFTDLGEKCRNCKDIDSCTVCIGSAYGEFKKFSPNKDACEWTEIEKEIAT
ncbi:MAG: radical SAM protein [Lachnospiraceae bacterium]|nr:radical SAM protein [Lachnospiraceae bacterium]